MDPYLLDTNILVHYIRKSDLYRRVEAAYRLETVADPALISIASEGEIRSLALQFGWGAARMQAMEELLSRLVIVPIDRPELVDAYVEIDYYSERTGQHMEKNDVWIAATAFVTTATLLTSDQDFDHLDPGFLTRHWINPKV